MMPTLSGAQNFRSLQGLPAAGGRRIAGHTLLRSDQLDRLSDEDWAVLAQLGLRTICDLRSGPERQRRPNGTPGPEVQQVVMSVIADVRSDPRYGEMLMRQPNLEGAAEMAREVYRQLPEAFAPHLPTLFALFDAGEVPVLIHCAAGKDRTGFAVAVLLHALGVPEEAIFEDYLRTALSGFSRDPARRAEAAEMLHHLIGHAGDEAMVDAILGVDESYLRTAFDTVTEQYGSMDQYLAHHAGLDAPALARWRERWLTD